MFNEERLILDYMAMLSHLSVDLKLRLISRLTESLRKDYEEPVADKDKDDSWKSLFGSWSDTDDDLAVFIRNNRLPNRDIPNFE